MHVVPKNRSGEPVCRLLDVFLNDTRVSLRLQNVNVNIIDISSSPIYYKNIYSKFSASKFLENPEQMNRACSNIEHTDNLK